MTEIGLADVVRALRAELETAMSEGKGQRVQFEATAIDMEFQIGVTKSVEGKTGVHFWVIELGGGGSYTSESIQKVSLSLRPELAGGGGVKIAKGTDESPLAHASNEETRTPQSE
jgi:hypothetical protein